MALLLKKLYHGYNYCFYEIADPRTDTYIISSPLVLIGMCVLYIYVVKFLGPELMKNRKPFEIKNILIIYNILQILFNVYLMFRIKRHIAELRLGCMPVDYSTSPGGMDKVDGFEKFLLLKLFDWVDTLFFVLRKRTRQLTFLHIYHHCGMVLVTWAGFRYIAGGNALYVGIFNLPIHAMMFTYYLMTSIDSSWKKNTLMKRFLTQLQMVQFLAFIFLYGIVLLDSNCGFPKVPCYMFVVQNIFMLVLFAEFYRKTYMSPKKLKQEYD